MGTLSFPEVNRSNNSGFKSTQKEQPNVLINPTNQQASQQGLSKPMTIPQPTQNNSLGSLNRQIQQQQGLQQPSPNNLSNNGQMGSNFMNSQQQQQQQQYNQGSVYNNLMYGNMALSNYLQTVKTNNNGLYDGMVNPTMSDQMMHKSNLERFIQSEQHQKML